MARRNRFAIQVILCISILAGCASYGPAEIHYGQDQCDYCKMNIVDSRFGSQLVTSKGRAYKFDSVECLAAFTQNSEDERVNNALLWMTDFERPGTFVRVDSATIVLNEQQNSPMGLGLVAFNSASQAETFAIENDGRILNWAETCALVTSEWKL